MRASFADLSIGAEFEFFGRRYTKVASSLAEDDKGIGHVLQGESQAEIEAAEGAAHAEALGVGHANARP
jgi:hypothetical protein